ncbi:MAG TPA: FxsA family protein [Polyangiaceae bacterium]
MLRGLVVLFIVVPILELYLLTLIARATSFWVALGLAVGTGVVGGILAKREGLRVWRRWQAAMREMRVPDEGVISGMLVLLGGVLLVTPGVLTDVAGMLLLIPPTRRTIAAWVRRRVDVQLGTLSTAWPAGAGLGGSGFGGAPPRRPGAMRGGSIDTSGTSLDP